MIQEFLKYLTLELNRSQTTVKAYEIDLRGFNEFLVQSGVPTSDAGFFIPSAVTTADIREWTASLAAQGKAPAYIRRKMQSLRAFFKFLMKRGVTACNPASAIPLPKISRKLPSIATHADVEKSIEEASTPQEVLILEMLYGCGLRRSELVGISDSDINPFTRELKILGKGNKHRIIPLPESLMEKIKGWQLERDRLFPDLESPRPLFATRRGRMKEAKVYAVVSRALASSHAERKSPHTLRHSCATQLLNAGADINSVKELLGHSSLGATQIYTHLAFSELSKEWAKAHPRAKKDDWQT